MLRSWRASSSPAGHRVPLCARLHTACLQLALYEEESIYWWDSDGSTTVTAKNAVDTELDGFCPQRGEGEEEEEAADEEGIPSPLEYPDVRQQLFSYFSRKLLEDDSRANMG
ncbi:hypothetical protein M406DRAFT_329497 [Cryphonectria parasitica EP155]|uniref:Uncharacterized protein n=1 Tax=Cryphonectria parasitica (strain ATCC 38755 / EP155) TaxID=660469 RepID=A0A9P4Y251_CRYP1|nr:uncharacterized protein M406DRAFT_329497 [Cryphonectria parasitica EP155]KAF3765609.1 hypothetical protein M406DRAFT_329497 [Cryphonectria parasitica EP155]